MHTKNILGLLAVSAFVIKGCYALHQYNNNKRDWNQTLGGITKDAMSGINDIVEVFSDDKREVALCNAATEIGKSGIDLMMVAERR